MTIRIIRLNEKTSLSLMRETAELITQLSRRDPDLPRIADLCFDAKTCLIVAMGSPFPIGTATLHTLKTATVDKGIIENVVVDKNNRDQGIGGKLIRHLIETAREQGLDYVDLTSRPEREQAQRLYKRLGFVQRDTNVFRFMFPRP